MGHLQKLVHRILVVLDVLNTVVFRSCRCDLITVVQISDLDNYRIGKRVFIETVQQICVIAPSVAEVCHSIFLALIIGVIHALFFFDADDDLIGLFLAHVIIEVDLNGVIILLDGLSRRIDVDHQNEENAQDQQHRCDRENGRHRHDPVSQHLHKCLF